MVNGSQVLPGHLLPNFQALSWEKICPAGAYDLTSSKSVSGCWAAALIVGGSCFGFHREWETGLARDLFIAALVAPSLLGKKHRAGCSGSSLRLGLRLPAQPVGLPGLFLEVFAQWEGSQMLEPEVHTLSKPFSAFRAARWAPSWQISSCLGGGVWGPGACGAHVRVRGFLSETH